MLRLMTCSLVLLASFCASEPKLEKVYAGLKQPWALEFVDENTLLFTEKAGRLGVLDLKKQSVTSSVEIPHVYAKGQAALFDLALSKNFKHDGLIYFSYAKKYQERAVTAVATVRFRSGHLGDVKDFFVTDSFSNTNRHFGGRIAVDDSYLFVTVGDRGVRDNAQKLGNHAGKVLRLNLKGLAAGGNPFSQNSDAKAEIFSIGHRNAQGIAFDDQQRLWAVEHGPRGGDELNLIEAGNNYGWPIVSLGKEYWGPVSVGVKEKKGMIPPVHSYEPSIAPSDLLFLAGKFYISALNGKHLNIVELDANNKVKSELRWFSTLGERIRALTASADGFVYFATDSGTIYRFRLEF